MKKLITISNIGLLVAISLLIYLLLVGLTEMVFSGEVMLSAFILMIIIRGLEAHQEGRKITSLIIFTVSIAIFIILVLSLF
ncbi:hypothetical protein FZC78_16440 [Rossellomorea vietnamensis]|uniref:DUF3953 domain-containing protein n=1 Tax=Rossellomorea vietnamensis TaxID=218284 RepID=A0A5D4NQW5_9BACI|nr:hypothetical protein [Rossellomorea vietnamensis]TYS15242.1 hypothetical protein FZC78_16440 [Rossellomorea vietnamensis]